MAARIVAQLMEMLFSLVRSLCGSKADLTMEVLALRQQLSVYKRKNPRPHIDPFDRLFWSVLKDQFAGWIDALVIVKPERPDPRLERGATASCGRRVHPLVQRRTRPPRHPRHPRPGPRTGRAQACQWQACRASGPQRPSPRLSPRGLAARSRWSSSGVHLGASLRATADTACRSTLSTFSTLLSSSLSSLTSFPVPGRSVYDAPGRVIADHG